MGFLWDIYNSIGHKDFSDYKKYSSQIIFPEQPPVNERKSVSYKKYNSVSDFTGNNSRI